MIRVISLNKLNCFLSLLMNNSYQWRIQGGGDRGARPLRPLFLDQTLAPRAEKSVSLETAPPYPKVWIRRSTHTTNLL